MMTEMDHAAVDHLLSMEDAGLLSADEVFTELVSGSWWSVPVRKVVSHGKKRRR